MSAINPTYVAYAAAHGRTPEQQLAHDHEAWPGGVMCGFILWVSKARQVAIRDKIRAPDGGLMVSRDGVVWYEKEWHAWLQDPASWPLIGTVEASRSA